MTSKREAKLRKIFPESTEKILKGHLMLTQNSMYFYSTKNIQAPLPNPLAVHSTFKDLSSIEKQGLDIIVIKKGEEEIVLDSFQFRNETFDALQRSILIAKGKSVDKATASQKEEYLPLDMETKELMKRTLDGLPFFNDLGLLSQYYTISAKDKPLFVGKETQSMKNYERLKAVLLVGVSLFDNQRDKFVEAFDKYFAEADSEKVRTSATPPTVVEFLKTNFGDDHPVVVLFKACIHPITAAVIRIKTALTSFYPTKDKSWEVSVVVTDDAIEVQHLRHEECAKGSFQVQWKETLQFDRKMQELKSVSLFVTDLIFHDDTREPTRYEIQNLLKDFLPPADKTNKTATVLLPSFVDLSNQKLTAIPDFVFDMPQLQTLYLHANQLEELPEQITKLTNLQVLYLNQNKFSTFPTIVCSLPNLQELHLGSNKITEIPREIEQMQKLRELSLSYNQLSGDLPKELCSLKNLRKLYLHNNYLESLPPALADLPLLKTLQIHNNQRMEGTMKTFDMHDSESILKFLRSQKKD